jgi:peptidyl-tRNA hydrolase, PTH1 family
VWLLVGLGNPGPEYEGTRHNVGFQVIDAIAAQTRAPAFRSKLGAEISETLVGSERILLCKPMEYMNLSGQAVARVAKFWKIEPTRTLVVYDDLDLSFGRLKLGAGGGHGGHNGVRSIIAEWGTADFHRVRVGIGRPPAGADPTDYLLTDFKAVERKTLPDACARAADAALAIVSDGLTVAMNRFNTKRASGPKSKETTKETAIETTKGTTKTGDDA